MIRRVVSVTLVAASALLAAPAQAECLYETFAVNVCYGYRPIPRWAEQDVSTPVMTCYFLDCIPAGERLATVPVPWMEGGRPVCVHVGSACVVPVDVPSV